MPTWAVLAITAACVVATQVCGWALLRANRRHGGIDFQDASGDEVWNTTTTKHGRERGKKADSD